MAECRFQIDFRLIADRLRQTPICNKSAICILKSAISECVPSRLDDRIGDAPPRGNRVEAAGLKEGMIPVGAKVTAEGHRQRDPKVFEVKTERVKWNGKTFNVYPDRT